MCVFDSSQKKPEKDTRQWLLHTNHDCIPLLCSLFTLLHNSSSFLLRLHSPSFLSYFSFPRPSSALFCFLSPSFLPPSFFVLLTNICSLEILNYPFRQPVMLCRDRSNAKQTVSAFRWQANETAVCSGDDQGSIAVWRVLGRKKPSKRI